MRDDGYIDAWRGRGYCAGWRERGQSDSHLEVDADVEGVGEVMKVLHASLARSDSESSLAHVLGRSTVGVRSLYHSEGNVVKEKLFDLSAEEGGVQASDLVSIEQVPCTVLPFVKVVVHHAVGIPVEGRLDTKTKDRMQRLSSGKGIERSRRQEIIEGANTMTRVRRISRRSRTSRTPASLAWWTFLGGCCPR